MATKAISIKPVRYPTQCLSAYCGDIPSSDSCKQCRHRPALDAWKAFQAAIKQAAK